MLQNGTKDFVKEGIVIMINLVFRLLKWLLAKKNDDDLIVDICEELLDMGDFDRFIISRSNCPMCGEDFSGNHWNCHCLGEYEQRVWFNIIDYMTLTQKGYSFQFYMPEEG